MYGLESSHGLLVLEEMKIQEKDREIGMSANLYPMLNDRFSTTMLSSDFEH